MRNIVLRGGKTSPRLLKDLQLYNPQLIDAGGDNILTSLPPPFNEETYTSRYPKGACQHDWMIKENQSILLRGDPAIGKEYSVAACCARCCCHVNLLLALGQDADNGWPCSDIHHFVHDSTNSVGLTLDDIDDQEHWRDEQIFGCRETGCPAVLKVTLFAPRLDSDYTEMLTSREKIETRARAAIAADKDRMEGVPVPLPVTVLSNLRTYITDSLKNASPHRIADNNKKWQVSLGDPCRGLLQYLGFTRMLDHWLPPRPDVGAAVPFTNELNILLDDVSIELNILIAHQPQHERQNTQANAFLGPAQGEMAALLNCRDYKKNPSARTQGESSYDEEHPWYAVLGSVMDFHDDLLKRAYHQQVQIDSMNTTYYFDCLVGIAQGRDSVELQTEVALQESKGVLGTAAIEEAYRCFGFDMDSWNLNEDMIIGNFQARVVDSPPQQEHRLRQALVTIGKHRGSQKIIEYTENSVNTYEQALSWLNATEDMTDDFIVTMAQLKMNDNPLHEETTRKAVSLIADKRGSGTLKAWVTTGEMIESDYTPDQAYVRLGISADCDEQTVLVGYKEALQNQPSQRIDLQKALKVIADHKKSSLLRNHCEGDSPNYLNPGEWPVGLENTSNACHFNSTLQMLFSIKAFRNLIIDSEKHKKSLDRDEIKRHTVGNRRITRSEVKHGQEFLDDMRATFEDMITSPLGFVAPKEAMVENAFSTSITSPGLPSPIAMTAPRDHFEGIDATLVRSRSNGPDGISNKETTDAEDDDGQEAKDTGKDDSQNVEMKDVSSTVTSDTEENENTEKPNEKVLPKTPPPPVVTDTSFRQQQDVTETAGNTFFRLSCAIAATNNSENEVSEQDDQIIDLFFGRSKDLNADTGDKTSDQAPFMFNIVSVNTRDTLEESIESNWCYVPEGSKNYRYTSISKLPPVFQVQINRRQYSADKGAWKDDCDVKIPETLYLGQFLDSADQETKKQWRDIARTILALDRDLGDRKDMLSKKPARSETQLSPPEVFANTASALQQVADVLGNDDPDADLFRQASRDLSDQLRADEEELIEIDKKIEELTNKLKTMREAVPKTVPYRLHSVFVHRGTATSGHYFVFIYDFKEGIWRKYNDKIVEKADPASAAIFHNYQQSGFASKDTPFFMTYVVADRVEELVDPLCRHIEKKVQAETNASETSQVLEGVPVSNGDGEGDAKMEMTENISEQAPQAGETVA